MANFLLLYTGGSMPETPAEQEAVLKAWGAWYGKIGSNLVDGGNPFTPIAKSISSNGAVSDGPVGELATGYTIIKADSLDAAVAIARECPVLQGGSRITVYETFPVM
ncbi:MAG TPA: hypothetical protein VED37_20680 [Ktedonobacteraceae bacterium]|nr:hypothetical protein [Ktedonobacteraceae bacterium]